MPVRPPRASILSLYLYDSPFSPGVLASGCSESRPAVAKPMAGRQGFRHEPRRNAWRVSLPCGGDGAPSAGADRVINRVAGRGGGPEPTAGTIADQPGNGDGRDG